MDIKEKFFCNRLFCVNGLIFSSSSSSLSEKKTKFIMCLFDLFLRTNRTEALEMISLEMRARLYFDTLTNSRKWPWIVTRCDRTSVLANRLIVFITSSRKKWITRRRPIDSIRILIDLLSQPSTIKRCISSHWLKHFLTLPFVHGIHFWSNAS